MPNQLVTYSAANFCDAAGNLVPLGSTVQFQPVLSNGKPTGFKIGGGGIVTRSPITVQVTTAGAFSAQLADTTATFPVNIGYAITATYPNGLPIELDGYGCVQNLAGTNLNLDTYNPNLAPQVTVAAGPAGAPGLSGISLAQTTAILSGAPFVPSTAPSSPGTPAVTTVLGSLQPASSVANSGGADTWFIASPFTVAAPITDIIIGFNAGVVAGSTLKMVLGTLSNGGQDITITNEWSYTIPATISGYTEVHLQSANGDFTPVTPQVGQLFGAYCTAGGFALGAQIGNDGSFVFQNGDQTAVGNGFGLNANGNHINFQVTTTTPATAGSGVADGTTTGTLDPAGYYGKSTPLPASGVTIAQLTSILTGQPYVAPPPGGGAVTTVLGNLQPASSVANAGNADTWYLIEPFTVSAPITDIVIGFYGGLVAGSKLKMMLATPASGNGSVTNTNEWEYTIPASASGYQQVHLTVANGDFPSGITPQVGQLFGAYCSAGGFALGSQINNDGSLSFAGGDNSQIGVSFALTANGNHPNFQITTVTPAGGNTSGQLDPEGYLGASHPITATVNTSAGFATSDAVTPDQAATLVELASYAAARTWVPATHVMPLAGVAQDSWGDSLTYGLASTNPNVNSFPAVMAAALGTTLGNHGNSTDEASDLSLKVWGRTGLPPRILHTLMIGSTEALHQGAPTLPVHLAAHLSSAAWLAIGGPAACVDFTALSASGWSNYTGLAGATGKQCSTSGAALSIAITTHGQPLYVFTLVADGSTAALTATVDGGAATTITCTPPAVISAPNGATSYVQLTRIPVAAGAHTLVLTSSNASNVIVTAVGTPPAHTYGGAVVLCGGIIPVQGDSFRLLDAQYTLNVLANVRTLQCDGLDVRFVDTRSVIKASDLAHYTAANNPHLNDAGYALLAQPWITTAQLPPAREVNRSTPPSSAAYVTPGDEWTDGTWRYRGSDTGTLTRTAVSYATW